MKKLLRIAVVASLLAGTAAWSCGGSSMSTIGNVSLSQLTAEANEGGFAVTAPVEFGAGASSGE